MFVVVMNGSDLASDLASGVAAVATDVEDSPASIDSLDTMNSLSPVLWTSGRSIVR